MNEQNLLTLFFIDPQGNENYGLALVPGQYRAQPDTEARKAYLIIYMCIDCDSAFAFYYVDSAGKYIGHSLLHPGEESIDYVLLEAWLRFNVLPFYWILAEETEHSSITKKFSEPEHTETYFRLREVLSRFRWAENAKAVARKSSTEDDSEVELNRLFYPDVPKEIFTPLTL